MTDKTKRVIITVDGPAGSGKSTVARLLAGRLGFKFLDTGAMYRGVTAYCLDRDIDPATQAQAVAAVCRRLTMQFDWQSDPPRLSLDGVDVTDRLRDEDVTHSVSDVAVIPEVRQVLVRAQQSIGQQHPGLVSEGRDQGSVVFPEAAAKFYLDATPQTRARRRAEQLRAAGRAADEAAILESILRRDQRDADRPDGPLICPKDAQRIDTSLMTIDEVVDRLEEKVQRIIESLPAGVVQAVVNPGAGEGSKASVCCADRSSDGGRGGTHST